MTQIQNVNLDTIATFDFLLSFLHTQQNYIPRDSEKLYAIFDSSKLSIQLYVQP